MFIADDNGMARNNMKTNNAVLMAFYEAVHLNRNFITLLTTVFIFVSFAQFLKNDFFSVADRNICDSFRKH